MWWGSREHTRARKFRAVLGTPASLSLLREEALGREPLRVTCPSLCVSPSFPSARCPSPPRWSVFRADQGLYFHLVELGR